MGTIGQVEGSLYQTFPERAPTDDDATVVVLDGTRKDFAGRSRAFVDKDDEFPIGIDSVLVAAPFLAGRVDTLGEDDELVFGEELVDELDSSFELTARVAAQLKDERFHALAL